MKYIEYGQTSDGAKLFAREDDDGLIRFTCIESNPDYQEYLRSLKEVSKKA